MDSYIISNCFATLKLTPFVFRCAAHHVAVEEGDGQVQGRRRGRAADEAVRGGAAAVRGRAGGARSWREFITLWSKTKSQDYFLFTAKLWGQAASEEPLTWRTATFFSSSFLLIRILWASCFDFFQKNYTHRAKIWKKYKLYSSQT